MNPLVELQTYGQSFWYDNMRRKFLLDGSLATLIADDGLRGVTSNPTIFEKAIGGSDDYDAQIAALAQQGADLKDVYESLVIADIRMACDLFADLYARSNAQDGYVSLEVSPHLAHHTEGTVEEARRLWGTVNRPNLMIKVPATPEGIPAIRQLLGQGININITLMFNMAHYEAVAQAYLDGAAHWLAQGGQIGRLASVASFFVSRVDSAVDKALTALHDPAADALRGQAAIANCQVVYQRFKEIFHGAPFAGLRAAGARPQRLLWASTSTKNPAYPDTLYVDNLIGPETVNTMPPATIEAFRDHGRLGNTLEENLAAAQDKLKALGETGLDLDDITEQLQVEGVDAFARSFDSLFETLRLKLMALAGVGAE